MTGAGDDGQVSRRALLLGGLGAAVVGAGAVAEARIGHEKVLRKLGLSSSPDYVSTGRGPKPVTHTLDSDAMRQPVKYAVSAPAEPRGLVLCLHGRNNNYRFPFDVIHLHNVVAEQDAGLVIVGVNGGPSSYWHTRASGIDPQAMLHDELLPTLDQQLGRALPRAVLGWSMGGYGALLSAERHPDTYEAVAAASPALFPSASRTSPGAFDNAEDYRRHDVFAGVDALDGMTVRIDCGTGDPFIAATRSFAAKLRTPNRGAFTDGFHDAAYWRSIAPAQIRTLADALT